MKNLMVVIVFLLMIVITAIISPVIILECSLTFFNSHFMFDEVDKMWGYVAKRGWLGE